jgi:hypothetical protein
VIAASADRADVSSITRAAHVLVSFVGRSFSTNSCATRRHLTGWDGRPTSGLSQRPGEAGGSLTLEAQGRVGAAPTTTGRVGTARRPGPGKRDGKVYVLQEPVVEPPQERNRLEIWRIGAGPQRTPNQRDGRATRTPVEVAGQEATGKVCGVPVARLPGNSWAPTPSTG